MPFSLVRNDLSHMETEAIVIAANEQLAIGGGAGESVAKAAGRRQLQRACNALGGCPTGRAVATPGFNLTAKHLIHAVGPVWQGGTHGEAALLRSAYDEALALAARLGAASVALPLLSAGSYGFPVRLSFDIAIAAIKAFLREHDLDVVLVLFDKEAVTAGSRLFAPIAAYIDDTYAQEALVRQRLEARPLGTAALPVGYTPAAPAPSAAEPTGATPSSATPAVPSVAAPTAPAALPASPAAAEPLAHPEPSTPILGADQGLHAWIDRLVDEPFSAALLHLIDERGLDDVAVYKRANMSRQLFSKIRSDRSYRPTKRTALSLAVALELDLDETADLLSRAGLALSHSSTFDIIVEYFIVHGDYDIFAINEALYAFDQPLLA